MTLRAVLLIATWVASGLGDSSLAAHQIVTTLVAFFAFALDAFAIAGQTLTGTALGAGDKVRTRHITDRVIAWGAGVGLVAGMGLITLSRWIPHLFTGDATVRETASRALIVVGVMLPISGIVYVLDGVLIGAGDGTFLAWAGGLTLLAYAPAAALVFAFSASLTWLWWAYGLFMLVRWATLWLRQRSEAWMVLGGSAERQARQ